MKRPYGLVSRTFTAGLAVASLLTAAGASAATLPSGFSEQRFTGITNPTALAFAPDGRVFVSQQCGQIRIIKNGALVSAPFASVSVSCSDERGLHSIAFDPNFASNGFVYVRYTRSSPTNNVIGRLTASPPSSDTATSNSPTVLFTVPFNGNRFHHGGGLVVGNDGMLYSSFGDHQSGSGQGTSNLWGKVIRINRDGSIPGDNPFPSASGNNRAIWANGFRNPFTLAIQRGTGRIHVNDVGDSASSGREEVNALTRGGNFNWPNSQGAGSFFNYAANSQGGNAITGGGFYNPQTVMFPASFVGRYFFADYGGGWIRSINGSGSAGGLQGFASGISGPTDVEAASDGSLWYTSRNSSSVGRIRFGSGGTPTPTPRVTVTPTPTPTPRPSGGRPVPVINAPAATLLFKGGDTVSFAGDCTDPEDGTEPASRLSWSVVFHHTNHTHGETVFAGVKSGSFSIPRDIEWDPIQWWRINLTCRDAANNSVTIFRDVQPQLRRLTLQSSPAGRQVAADGVSGAAPQAMDAVAGIKRSLNAPSPQMQGAATFVFQSWSDGGAQRHDIFMPNANTTLTANFRNASTYMEAAVAAANIAASTSDANVPANTVDNNLGTRWSANGDNQWIRFDLGSARTVGHVRVAVYQGNMRRNRFDIQVGNAANGPWTTAFTGESSGTTTAEELYDFADVSARFVRYLGHGNVGASNPLINSVTEVSILTSP
jgi:glucose/arabinose dehydrogenase